MCFEGSNNFQWTGKNPSGKLNSLTLFLSFSQQEKKVLEVLNFPYIVSLVRTYKDNHYVYFLLEYVHGMELYQVIRNIGTIYFLRKII